MTPLDSRTLLGGKVVQEENSSQLSLPHLRGPATTAHHVTWDTSPAKDSALIARPSA